MDAHCQDPIAHRQRGGGVAVRAQAFGAAGDGDQQGGLLGFQGVGRHAEPGQGAGTDALEIAAERRQRQPDVEHATAAETELELEGAGHLDQLRAQGARAGLQQAGGLHGDGGAAGYDVARADELGGGTEQGERIDAGMEPEAPVLDRDQQGGQEGWLGLGAEAPDAAGSGKEGQGAVVAVEDLGADGGEAGQVGREGAVEGDAGGGEEPEKGGEEGQDTGAASPLPLREGVGGRGAGQSDAAPSPSPSRKGRGRALGSPCRRGLTHSDPTIVIRPAA